MIVSTTLMPETALKICYNYYFHETTLDEHLSFATLFYMHSSSVLWDDNLKDQYDPYLV